MSAPTRIAHRTRCPTGFGLIDAQRVETHDVRGPEGRWFRVERCCDCGAHDAAPIPDPTSTNAYHGVTSE